MRLAAAYEDLERQVFLTTRDLSEVGVYLLAADLPPLGCSAQVTLELPGEPAMVRLRGAVVRRCPSEPSGFALRFDPAAVSSASRRGLRRFLEGPRAPAR